MADFDICDAGTCVTPQKQCAGNCSGHGNCSFVDTKFGTPVSACLAGSSRCKAVCDCDDAYWGSATCSITVEELELKQLSRLQVIQTVQALMELENVDRDTIIGWISSLIEVAQVANELSEEGAIALLERCCYCC